jgi:hypothetical protein
MSIICTLLMLIYTYRICKNCIPRIAGRREWGRRRAKVNLEQFGCKSLLESEAFCLLLTQDAEPVQREGRRGVPGGETAPRVNTQIRYFDLL